MYRRKLLGLAVSLAALAATAAPAGAAPVGPDAHPDHIIAVLIGLEVQSRGPVSGSSPASAGFFKSVSGMNSETEFMDYTDDALLDSARATGLKLETEVTDYVQRRTASGIDVWGLDRRVFSGDAYDNEKGITTQASVARPNSEIRPR
jgi:hypothetical protein